MKETAYWIALAHLPKWGPLKIEYSHHQILSSK